MQQLLLIFPFGIEDRRGLDEIVSGFEEQGYNIHEFNDVAEAGFSIDILPQVIDYLTTFYAEEHNTCVDRIVVLSNLKEIIFSWYRCYNWLVDDFVYFIDRESTWTPDNTEDFLICRLLASFAGISTERVEGRIYLNINMQNYQSLYPFLLLNNNFRFFDRLNNFDFSTTISKARVHKIYHLNNTSFSFENENSGETQTILLDSSPSEMKIDEKFAKLLDDGLFFLIFLLKEMYGRRDDPNVCGFLINYFKHLNELAPDSRRQVCSDIGNYVAGEISFPEKIFFLSLLTQVKLDEGDRRLENIMRVLREDDSFLDYHYPVLTSVLGFINRDGITVHEGFYAEKRAELGRITGHFERGIPRQKTCRNTRHVAVIVDQLSTRLHAPTGVIVNHVVRMREKYPELIIKVFVEDNLCLNPSELLAINYYTSTRSSSHKKDHDQYFDGTGIEVYYCDIDKTKKDRTQDFVREVRSFAPGVILTTSDLSIATRILYADFPIVYISHGETVFTSQADVYLHPNRDKVHLDNMRYGLAPPELIHEFKGGVSFSEPAGDFSRSDFGISEKDFVLVTVGTRLDSEMNEAFIDAVCSFLRRRNYARWIIVGPARLTYLIKNYHDLDKQIIRVPFEKDLPGLYRICDVYVNPRRTGGGISIAMAMNSGLPVIITSETSDGLEYVGEANCSGPELEDCIRELDLLCTDSEYRTAKGRLMQERVRLFDLGFSVEQLVQFFELAQGRFAKRHGIGGNQ